MSVPNGCPEDITSKIQIQHLLTHTSGLGSYFNDEYFATSKNKYRELNDYQPLLAGERLEFEPGSAWRYSNSGMLLLGVVIEKITGQSYFDYVRENVYAPAGMLNTDCYEMDRPVPNLAIGYFEENGQWKNNLFLHVLKGGPAGGGFSTVEDLYRFSRAIRTYRLLDRVHTEQMLSPHPQLNSPGYGFGFGTEIDSGNRIVGHTGGFPGISAVLEIHLDSGFTLAALSNQGTGTEMVASKLRNLLLRLGR